MTFDQQPIHLKNDLIELVPLETSDFDRLFSVASDPLIWTQHPNPNRYQLADFKIFFDGAILSKGAFIILDSKSKEVIGSTRFYDFKAENKSVKIGYTFIGRKYWGNNTNNTIKSLMMTYVFETLETVIFEIGDCNIRSQKAICKIGAIKIGEQEIAYFGESIKTNFVYKIDKQDFLNNL